MSWNLTRPRLSTGCSPATWSLVIRYDSGFENKQAAVETVTPMLDKDGKWRVSSYFTK